jgi:hypothetical protein
MHFINPLTFLQDLVGHDVYRVVFFIERFAYCRLKRRYIDMEKKRQIAMWYLSQPERRREKKSLGLVL